MVVSWGSQGGEYPTIPSILMMLRLETSDLRRWDGMAKDGFMPPRTPWLTMTQGSWKCFFFGGGGIKFDANLWQFWGMSLFWCMSPMNSISCLTKLFLDGKHDGKITAGLVEFEYCSSGTQSWFPLKWWRIEVNWCTHNEASWFLWYNYPLWNDKVMPSLRFLNGRTRIVKHNSWVQFSPNLCWDPHPVDYVRGIESGSSHYFTKHFRYLKWRYSPI